MTSESPKSTASDTARVIASLIGMDVWVRSGSVWTHADTPGTPAQLRTLTDPIAHAYAHPTIEGQTTLVRDDYGFVWAVSQLRGEPLVAGPAVSGPLTARGVEAQRWLPALPPSRSEEDFRLLAALLELLAANSADAATKGPIDESAAATSRATPTIVAARELPERTLKRVDAEGSIAPGLETEEHTDLDVINARYRWERELREIITRGDRPGLTRLLGRQGTLFTFQYRLPHNPLRVEKNMSIVLGTVLRSSAGAAGVLPRFLHATSEEFAIRIEQLRTPEEVAELRTEMMYRYCDLVAKTHVGHHSAPVRRVVRYILEHIDEPSLGLETLTSIAGCSAAHLARLFRREYGMSVGAYIRERRVDEARWILTHSDTPIAEVADALGFRDVDYFGRVFRTVTGVPPARYRRQYAPIE